MSRSQVTQNTTPDVLPFEALLGPFPELMGAASSRRGAPSCQNGHKEVPTRGSLVTEIK